MPPSTVNLTRVGDEVAEDLADPHRVAVDDRGEAGLDLELQRQALGIGDRPIGRLHRGQQLAQVEGARFEGELAGLDLREVEDVGKDPFEALGAGEDLLEVVAARFRRQRLDQRQAGQAEQAVQRRADLVAGVGEEGALGPARRFGGIAGGGEQGVEAAPLGHVVGDPDRAAFARPHGVDRLAEQAAPEEAAVLLLHLALDLERLPGGEQRPGELADLGVLGFVDPDHRARLVAQLARRPAEDRLEARVDLDEAAVAGQGDADRGALEDRRVLEPCLLRGGDVAGIDDHVVAPVHGEDRRRDQHRGEPAGAGGDACRHRVDAAFAVERGAQPAGIVRVVPEAELIGGVADHLFGGEAGELAEGRVDQREAARVGLVEGDAIRAGGEQLREHRFRAAQRRFGGEPRRDVEHDGQGRRAAGGLDPDAGGLHADQSAVDGPGVEVAHRHAFADRQLLELGDAVEGALLRFAGRMELRHAHALHRLGVDEAEQARGRRVGIEDDALAVQEDRRGRALEQLAVARFAGGEGALGADLVGDVAGRRRGSRRTRLPACSAARR